MTSALLAGALAMADAEANIDPRFALSSEELSKMTASLPAPIQGAILSRPSAFLELMARVLDEPEELFVLVDKRHPLAESYVPPDLVPLKEYPVTSSWPGLQLRRTIMPAVLAMVRSARTDGVELTFSSAYRSFAYQQYVFQREVQMYGMATAERESAQAGCSQHQLGTAIDFGTISDAFADTREGRWVAAHAWEFGFSLSYPAGYEQVTGYRYESWHYRYLTKAGMLMQREFFGDVQQYFLEFLSANRSTLMDSRRKAK
jgi:D-alanyl-D-alanine carboxypeptidase